MAAAPPRLIRWLPSFTDIAFLMPAILLYAGLQGAYSLLFDGDTGWHIRTGEWILDHAAIPRQDLFSFTRPDHSWFAWEWLAEVAMAGLHRHGGMAVLVLAATLTLSLTFALLFRLLRRRSGNVLLAIALTAAAAGGSSIHWLARPHLFTLLLIVVFLTILERDRHLWLLPPLMVLWTNLHAGFAFGLVLLAAWALRRRGRQRARRYWLVLAASAAATLVNPYTWHLHEHVLRYLLADSWTFNNVNEFLSPSFHHPRALFFELMLGLAMAASLWHLLRRRYHYVLLLLLSGHMALVSARHVAIFVLVAATPVALALAGWLRLARRAELPGMVRSGLASFHRLAADVGAIDRRARIPLLSGIVVVLLATALLAPAPAPKFRAEFDPHRFPAAALASLGAAPSRIFTFDQWGDYLIYRRYPEIRVFIDGRSDFYGMELEQTCQNLLNVRYNWQQLLGRYGVDTVLLPAAAPLAGALKESARWRVVYDDASAIVFRRQSAPALDFGGDPPEKPQITLRSE